MAQNIYDDPDFFAGYAQLPRSIDGLDAAPEWPTLRRMLPSIGGADVVDLGCGYGWFCRWAADRSPRSVTGFDVSERMLDRAASDPAHHESIDYVLADLDSIELPTSSADLVYSSLALHYVVDVERLVEQIAGALRPGGSLVFSVEHPIRTAPITPHFDTDPAGERSWALGSYAVEGPRTLDWIAPGVVKQHRMVASYLTALIAGGLRIRAVEEWHPSEEQLIDHPEWIDHMHRPNFLLVAADRV